ncbi:MAG: ABC transporter permease subunit [Desulfomonile sp.]|nr:ABC transporter permease subunit [Desulfomonile sp.]
MNFRKISIACSFATFGLYALLILSLFYFFQGDKLLDTLLSDRTLFSIRLSLGAATISTVFSMLIALPAAFALSRYEFRGKRAVDTMLELPMIVSPAALGAMLLIFFNNPLGLWIQDHGAQFVFTFYGIVLAQFLTICGVSTRLIKAAMDEIPVRFEAVARTLGASPSKAFFTVTLPLSRRGLIAASVLSWAKALGEFGATITVAGSMAMKTETLPIAIFMRLSSAEIEGTVVLILILVSIGLSILYAVRFLSKGASYA